MKIDVNKLLDLEYLNELILQINSDIDKNKASFLQRYDLDILKKMELDAVNSLFSQYSLNNTGVRQYLESDYIDEKWEFADLFSDDISYSAGLRDDVRAKALEEINMLNSEIDIINAGFQRNIDELQNYLQLVSNIIKILNNKAVVSEEEIDELNALVINSLLSDEDKFLFSYNIVKYLAEQIKSKTKDDTKTDTSLFEREIEDIYATSNYSDDNAYEGIKDPTYSETIMSYYKYYKKLFDEVEFGGSITEVINFCSGLSRGIDTSVSSLSKEEFCIELVELLSLLNEENKRERSNQDLIADILIDLNILDKLYEDDIKFKEDKKELLSKVENRISIVDSLNVDDKFKQKILNRLSLIRIELKNNLINLKRKDEILKEYESIELDIEILMDTRRCLLELEKLSKKIVNMLKHGRFSNGDDSYYLNLTSLQADVLKLIDIISENGVNNEIYREIKSVREEFNEYIENEGDAKKTELKGFVLFDFDEDNRPYVLSDLDPDNKNNMIDSSLLQKKMTSAFDDYNILIKDLLLYGTPGIIKDGVPTHMDRILNPVFFDTNRNNPTGMVRIRPMRNSLVRFIGQKVNLRAGTEIHNQVIDIIQDVIPNVTINPNDDFAIYVNFASALIHSEHSVYDSAINRYLRNSPLHKMLICDNEKVKLTDQECKILKDIVQMSYNTFSELEKANDYLSFDVITQTGGMKARV